MPDYVSRIIVDDILNSSTRLGVYVRVNRVWRRTFRPWFYSPAERRCCLCGKEGVQRIILGSIVVFPGACLGLRGENAGLMRGRGKNFPGMGLAEKRGYDSYEEQEPQPRFSSSRTDHQSGLELAAKRRRCKARMCHGSPPRR
jgi:hypothetical protein